MNNKSSSAEAFLPSMMSFSGLEGSSQKQHHIWDWETSSHNPNTTIPSTTYELQDHAVFPCVPLPDCPPPLLPMSNFHFYSPPPMPDYPVVLIKREDGTGGCGRIGLNLGHRTYFSSGDALAIDWQLSRSTLNNHQPRCQAEGCKADLSGAKHYHRRHRVCEFHSKATVVIVGGLQQRFCQQCSRFHVLAEFDEAKRSCRKRLADHNRRRRKPQLPTTTTTESSPSENTTTNSSEKATTDTPAMKTTTGTMCTKIHQQYQNKGNLLRNGPALSLAGAAVAEEKVLHQQQQQQQQPSSSSSAFNNNNDDDDSCLHHHNLFCSSSHEPFQATGGGSSQSLSDHHQGNIFHHGQASFEVDYM
ncbi:unnamed protein product [Musa banksii]